MFSRGSREMATILCDRLVEADVLVWTTRVESNLNKSSTPGGAHLSMPDCDVQRFICAAWV